MKIAASLGVKDEVELIGAAIAHLRAVGVHHILVSDSGSTDGTLGVLDRLAGPDLEVRQFDDRCQDSGYEARVTVDLVARARQLGADWMAFFDADEFPLPAGGDLGGIEGLQTADVLIMRRYNVPLLASGPALDLPPSRDLDRVLLYAPDTPQHVSASRVRQDPDAPWIGVIPASKVMIRTATVLTTAEGQHSAEVSVGTTRRHAPSDLVVAHVPFSTAPRFARKVDNIRAAIAAAGDLWGPDSAWHWRRWLGNIDKGGGAAGEMARNRVTQEELEELRRLGVVKSAAEVLVRA